MLITIKADTEASILAAVEKEATGPMLGDEWIDAAWEKACAQNRFPAVTQYTALVESEMKRRLVACLHKNQGMVGIMMPITDGGRNPSYAGRFPDETPEMHLIRLAQARRISELEKDAARYRWLRSWNRVGDWKVSQWMSNGEYIALPQEGALDIAIDAAIDAARSKGAT